MAINWIYFTLHKAFVKVECYLRGYLRYIYIYINDLLHEFGFNFPWG